MENINTKNGFTAKEYNFQGVPGYMVQQYYDNIVICSQFIAKSNYNDFCKTAGINPVIIN